MARQGMKRVNECVYVTMNGVRCSDFGFVKDDEMQDNKQVNKPSNKD